MYVVTVADFRGLISPIVDTGLVKKFLDIQGPVGVATANAATNYASTYGLVIDIGVGVLYTTLVTDVTGNVIRLFDEHIEHNGYFVNVNHMIQLLWDNRTNLITGQIPTFNPCSPYSGLTPNAGVTYKSLPFGGNSTLAFKAIIDKYLSQTNLTGPLYPVALPSIGCYVTKCITNFYALPINNPNCDYTVSLDYNFVCDSGTATFIAGVFLRHTIPDNVSIYT